MKSFLINYLLATSLIASVNAAIALEADEGQLASLIENAKILDKGYKVRVSLSGQECAVSTFRSTESVNTDNDCKITAALIAKELMIGHDFGIRKVRVYFHAPTMTGTLREVGVSYAEIQALEGGAVKQEDFLSSLSINMIPERSVSGSGSGAAGSSKEASGSGNTTATSNTADIGNTAIASNTTTTDNTTTTANTTTTGNTTATTGNAGTSAGPADKTALAAAGNAGVSKAGSSTGAARNVASKKPEAPVKIYTSPKNGLRFAIPDGWVVEDNFPHDKTLLFKLFSPANGERNIEFSFDGSSGKTPAECALGQRQKFNYSGVKIERYEQVKFGKGNYPGALIVLTYPNYDAEGKRYYEMHLYFGQKGGIYDLWGWSVFSQFKTVDPAFQKLMATMEFPAAKGASSKTKTPSKK